MDINEILRLRKEKKYSSLPSDEPVTKQVHPSDMISRRLKPIEPLEAPKPMGIPMIGDVDSSGADPTSVNKGLGISPEGRMAIQAGTEIVKNLPQEEGETVASGSAKIAAGAGTGALIGSAAGGVGAVPGAAIGAGIASIGVAASAISGKKKRKAAEEARRQQLEQIEKQRKSARQRAAYGSIVSGLRSALTGR